MGVVSSKEVVQSASSKNKVPGSDCEQSRNFILQALIVARGTGWGSGSFSLCQEQIALLIDFTEISIE